MLLGLIWIYSKVKSPPCLWMRTVTPQANTPSSSAPQMVTPIFSKYIFFQRDVCLGALHLSPCNNWPWQFQLVLSQQVFDIKIRKKSRIKKALDGYFGFSTYLILRHIGQNHIQTVHNSAVVFHRWFFKKKKIISYFGDKNLSHRSHGPGEVYRQISYVCVGTLDMVVKCLSTVAENVDGPTVWHKVDEPKLCCTKYETQNKEYHDQFVCICVCWDLNQNITTNETLGALW